MEGHHEMGQSNQAGEYPSEQMSREERVAAQVERGRIAAHNKAQLEAVANAGGEGADAALAALADIEAFEASQ